MCSTTVKLINYYYRQIRFIMEPISKKLYIQYMPEEAKIVPFEELKKHISLTIVNSHPSVGLARPLLPNTIEIGGYHIADPEPLPQVKN